MPIRFKCEHCQKPLSVKDHLAGKKAACPVCKKAIMIPVPEPVPGPEPTPADLEALAAEALADQPEKAPDPASAKFVEFTCPFCDEAVKLPGDLGGKRHPCPNCRNIVAVPKLQDDKPKDWRSKQQAGPSLARMNQPEQPDDAWSTAQKSRVSQTAMEEAGALPEVVAAPVGLAGWIKRGFWAFLIVGVGYVVVSSAFKARESKIETGHLKYALDNVGKFEPLHQAEVYRVAGVLKVRNLRADEAQRNFALAREKLSAPTPRDDLAAAHEHDLLLIQVVLAQIEMGGSGDETLKSGRTTQRFEWKDTNFHKDLSRTLEAIRAPEAKASALRQLACHLLAKEKLEIAISLASPLGNTAKTQLFGMQLALKEGASAPNLPKPPDPDKYIGDTVARVAYTEGSAYKKEFAAALKFATAKGPAAGQFEACVAGATIALADARSKDPAADALPFIKEGLEIYKKNKKEFIKDAKSKSHPWNVMEFIHWGSQTPACAELKDLSADLPLALRPRAQFDLLAGPLHAKNEGGVSLPIDEIGDGPNPIRALAWEAVARHNARLGSSGPYRIDEVAESFRPFIHLGIALGEKDPRSK